mgnify:CR=1 FL=1
MAKHRNGIMLIPGAFETRPFHEDIFGKCSGILALHRRPHFCHLSGQEAVFNSGATMVLVSFGMRNLICLKNSDLGVVLVEE